MDLQKALGVQSGDVVAFVGGGGKTSAMFRLGQTLARQNQRVLLTTSTRIFGAQIQLAPAFVTFDSDTQQLKQVLPALQAAIEQHSQVLLIGHTEKATGKAFGIAPEIIDQLAQSGQFDAIIIEADGSRMRPFKAPAAHEPVIPDSTSLVVPVVGLDILGKPLHDDHVHRAALVSNLSQTPLGAPITPETIAYVISDPEGGLKNIPSTARVISLLNKLDLVSPAQARTIANLILANPRIQAVALGSVQQEDSIVRVENRVAAVILAAGQASRFGSAKQLALWQGKPLLAHVVDAALASKAGPVVVVLGAHADACRDLLQDKPVQIVLNEDWAAGQSTSMRAGLAALPPHINAAIFPLADQPFVQTEIIDALIDKYQQTLSPLVWPEYQGKRGNPVLFDRRLFAEMNQITGDTGAKPVLMAHRAEATQVVVQQDSILRDIDHPEDL